MSRNFGNTRNGGSGADFASKKGNTNRGKEDIDDNEINDLLKGLPL